MIVGGNEFGYFDYLLAKIGSFFSLSNSEYELGFIYLKSNKSALNKRGIDLLFKSAENGNVNSQYALGQIFFFGDYGIEQNQEVSSKWFLRAAENNEPNSQHEIACRYEQGDGVVKNPEKAHYWWERAALNGIPEAQSGLSRNYKEGVGVKIDLGESYKWYLVSKKLGTSDSMDYGESLLSNLNATQLSEITAEAEKLAYEIESQRD